MVLLVLRPQDRAEHAVGFAHRFDYEVLDCLAEFLIPIDPEEAPVYDLAIVLPPVATVLELLPVPS